MSQRVRPAVIVYYIAITMLVAGLVVAVLFLTRVARPGSDAVTVGSALALGCEPGDGSPTCFAFTVQNRSSELVPVECLVVPAPGTTATFAGGDPSVVLNLSPGQEETLRTSVDTDDGSVVASPTLECQPLPR